MRMSKPYEITLRLGDNVLTFYPNTGRVTWATPWDITEHRIVTLCLALQEHKSERMLKNIDPIELVGNVKNVKKTLVLR